MSDRERAMFQLREAMTQTVAVGEDLIASGVEPRMVAEFEPPFVDGVLEFESKLGFVTLDVQVSNDPAEKDSGLSAANDPVELVTVLGVSCAVAVDMDRSTVGGFEGLHDGQIRHSETDMKVVSAVNAVGLLPGVYHDAPFTIEQAGNVAIIEHDVISFGVCWNDGEVGGHPMPGSHEHGRAIPSQAGSGDSLPGVCNEHVPSPKGKMCSELHGNMETLAEMSSAATYYMKLVTDCNTKYLKLKIHSSLDFRTGDFIEPDNQAAKVAKILFGGTLMSDNRRRLGTLHGLTAPA